MFSNALSFISAEKDQNPLVLEQKETNLPRQRMAWVRIVCFNHTIIKLLKLLIKIIPKLAQ